MSHNTLTHKQKQKGTPTVLLMCNYYHKSQKIFKSFKLCNYINSFHILCFYALLLSVCIYVIDSLIKNKKLNIFSLYSIISVFIN